MPQPSMDLGIPKKEKALKSEEFLIILTITYIGGFVWR